VGCILDALGLKESRHDGFLTEIKKETISHNEGLKIVMNSYHIFLVL